jgi:hypothetical protein
MVSDHIRLTLQSHNELNVVALECLECVDSERSET